jgi:hypothetical protein
VRSEAGSCAIRATGVARSAAGSAHLDTVMEPDDAMFWRSDAVRGVEDEHEGRAYSNVMYRRDRRIHKERRLPFDAGPGFSGQPNAADFASNDCQVDFTGRRLRPI